VRIKYLLLAALVFFSIQGESALAGGDELAVLKEQIEEMERRHREEIMRLKERIMSLESRPAAPAEARVDLGPIEERIVALEEQKPFISSELPSLRGWIFELGGEFEYEYVDTENDEAVSSSAPSNPGGHFSVDKLVLTPLAHYGDHLTLKADLEFTSDTFKLDEIYAKLDGLPTAPYLSYVKIGLEDVFNSPNAGWHRHTEDYPLIGTAFWQDEERMIELGGDISSTPLYWRFSLGNGRRLATRSNNDGSSGGYSILHDDDDNPDGNFNKEIKAGIGFKYETEEFGSIDVLGWGADAELSGADIAVLSGITGYTGGSQAG